VSLPVQGIDPGTFITGLQGKLFEFRAVGSGNMSMPALSGFSSPDQVREMFSKKTVSSPCRHLNRMGPDNSKPSSQAARNKIVQMAYTGCIWSMSSSRLCLQLLQDQFLEPLGLIWGG